MKKIISAIMVLLLAGCVAFGFSGCTDDNTLVCGVTLFDNMNEQDENGNWTGFETEFAQEVGKIIGMDVKFQIIDWGQKYTELNSGKIDCIWNGFTANSTDKVNGKEVERKELVDFSYTYMLNQQCIVVKKDRVAEFADEAALAGKSVAVESGSAGASYAEGAVGDSGNISEFSAQINTFLEVSSGRSDFAVVDILLAQNICGKGDYQNLVIVDSIELDAEYYAIGFKKGSNLTAKVNAAIKQLDESGKLMELAQKYGFENSLKVSYD